MCAHVRACVHVHVHVHMPVCMRVSVGADVCVRVGADVRVRLGVHIHIHIRIVLVYEPGKDGTFYRMHNDQHSFNDSMMQCEEEAGHLAIDDNKATHDYMAQTYGSPMWIGARYNIERGQWIWNNGQTINKTYWNGITPSGGNAALCLQTNYQAVGVWNDRFCRDQLPFLCQKSRLYLLYNCTVKSDKFHIYLITDHVASKH